MQRDPDSNYFFDDDHPDLKRRKRNGGVVLGLNISFYYSPVQLNTRWSLLSTQFFAPSLLVLTSLLYMTFPFYAICFSLGWIKSAISTLRLIRNPYK
jgi:hypothetical protein